MSSPNADKSNSNEPPATAQNLDNGSASNQASDADIISTIGRLANEHISSVLHSIFGIPTSLSLPHPSNWLSHDKDAEEGRLNSVENEHHKTSTGVGPVSAAIRRAASNDDDESGGSSTSRYGTTGGGNGVAPDTEPSDNDKVIRALNRHPLPLLIALGLQAAAPTPREYDKLHTDLAVNVRKQLQEMRSNIEYSRVIFRGEEEAKNAEIKSLWEALLDGRVFGSFFDEFLSEKPFGSSIYTEPRRIVSDIGADEDVATTITRGYQIMDRVFGSPMRPSCYIHESDISARPNMYARSPEQNREEGSGAVPLTTTTQTTMSESSNPPAREPGSELDLYDYFDQGSSSTKSAKPFVVGTMSSTTSLVDSNGVKRTKIVRERRYSDGSIERHEQEDSDPKLTRQSPAPTIEAREESLEGWSGWGEYGYPTGLGKRKEEMRKAFEEERRVAALSQDKTKNNQSDKDKDSSGWFWASGSK